jgi:hypothetical protein
MGMSRRMLRRDVDEVVPGVSIGPVKLGMTHAELKATGLWVRSTGVVHVQIFAKPALDPGEEASPP